MEPEAFNDDNTYKSCLDEVGLNETKLLMFCMSLHVCMSYSHWFRDLFLNGSPDSGHEGWGCTEARNRYDSAVSILPWSSRLLDSDNLPHSTCMTWYRGFYHCTGRRVQMKGSSKCSRRRQRRIFWKIISWKVNASSHGDHSCLGSRRISCVSSTWTSLWQLHHHRLSKVQNPWMQLLLIARILHSNQLDFRSTSSCA